MPASTATCWTRCSWATASTRPQISVGPTRGGSADLPQYPEQRRQPSRRCRLSCSSPTRRASAIPIRSRERSPSSTSSRATSRVTASYIWSRGIAIFTQRDLNLGDPTGNYTYTIQDAAGNNVSTFTTPVFTCRPRPGHPLRQDPAGRKRRPVLVQRARAAGGEALLAWLDRPDQLHLVPRHRRCQHAGCKLEHLQHLQQRHLQRQLSAGQGLFHARSAPPPVRQLAVEAHLHQQHFRLRQVLRERMGTLRHHHPGQRPPGERDHDRREHLRPTACSMESRSPTARINGSGGWNRVPFLPVGTLDIDQTYNVDARLTRSLPFGERVKANLSFEAFNAFNTIHNTAVQTAAYSVNAGGILKPVLSNGVSLVGTAPHPRASRTAPTPAVCRSPFASSSRAHPSPAALRQGQSAQAAAPFACAGHKTGTRRSGSAAESSRTRASPRRASPAAWKVRCPSRNSAGSAVPRAERELAYRRSLSEV